LPTGTVTFSLLNTATNLATTEQDTLSGGQVTLQQLLSPGSYQITATYAGDTNFKGNTSNTVAQTVSKANTTLTVASTATAAVYGQAVITATVSPVAPGGGTPGGTVTFTILNTTTNTTVTEQDTLSGGQARAATRLPPVIPGTRISIASPAPTRFPRR
jgi:hypothetical protein